MSVTVHPFEEALAMLDARQQRLTGQPISALDLSWGDRRREIEGRLTYALHTDGPPDLTMLEAAGAHLLALYAAAVEAHTTRIESGAEA